MQLVVLFTHFSHATPDDDVVVVVVITYVRTTYGILLFKSISSVHEKTKEIEKSLTYCTSRIKEHRHHKTDGIPLRITQAKGNDSMESTCVCIYIGFGEKTVLSFCIEPGLENTHKKIT